MDLVNEMTTTLLSASDGSFFIVQDSAGPIHYYQVWIKDGKLWYPHTDTWDSAVGQHSDLLVNYFNMYEWWLS